MLRTLYAESEKRSIIHFVCLSIGASQGCRLTRGTCLNVTMDVIILHDDMSPGAKLVCVESPVT